MKNLFILLIIIIFFSCKWKYNNKNNNYLNNNNIQYLKYDFIKSEIKNIEFKIKNTEFLYFILINNECSACIISFIDWRLKLNISSNNLYFYVFNSNDTYLFEYYFEKFGIKLNHNEYFINDKNEVFKKVNDLKYINSNYIIVTNNLGKIIYLNNM